MITNERHYQATRAAIRRFEGSLAAAETSTTQFSPRMRAAMIEGIESDLAVLRAEVAEYEALRAGQVRIFEAEELEALSDVLIRARIANGFTQKQLADTLGLKEQQIQQYEASQYEAASLRRLTEIARALQIHIRLHASLPGAQPQLLRWHPAAAGTSVPSTVRIGTHDDDATSRMAAVGARRSSVGPWRVELGSAGNGISRSALVA